MIFRFDSIKKCPLSIEIPIFKRSYFFFFLFFKVSIVCVSTAGRATIFEF